MAKFFKSGIFYNSLIAERLISRLFTYSFAPLEIGAIAFGANRGFLGRIVGRGF